MKNLKQTAASTGTALSILFLAAQNTFAQQNQWSNKTGINSDSIGNNFGQSFRDPGAAVSNVVNLLLFGAAIVAFIFILWGAFKYVMAGDDASKTQAARSTITNAVVGLILVALSFVIWLIVLNLTGLGGVVNANQ